MSLGKINLITPPDQLFNMNLGYLLVKPSAHVKMQFHEILSLSMDDVNVYVFDDDDTDITWLLSVAHRADVVIVDVDNCDPITKTFISFMLAQPNVFYMTSDDVTPYNVISKNRIFDLDWIVENIKAEIENFDDEDYDEDEEDDE